MSSSREVRQAFLDYFGARGHTVVPSGPLVVPDDPTLMFANAGMVQFKDVFTGREKRSYSRAASSQKCIRISGKHNDLENVGVTARHHTFFEMLGNFSFGDYFKREAIIHAWDFVTNVMGLAEDRLVVSVFGGDQEQSADEDAARLWSEIAGLGRDRILRCGAEDNFWSMGDTGPCGPCSEIHYYVGSGKPEVAQFGQEPQPDGSGWTEIWNLVFMQFLREEKGGPLSPLPAPSVDTGLGLERLVAIREGVTSNYDTDLLRPLIDRVAERSSKKYSGTLSKDDISMRVIADHARAAAFLIAEGVFPDKGRKEYVLRRVMRRAVRHGDRLGIREPFFHQVALDVVAGMGAVFPELEERRALIEDVTREEEERFRRTLKNGLDLLESNQEWIERDGQRVLPGAVAFRLYDTFGFPVDLQEVIGEEEGFGVDADGFAKEMERARGRSQGSKIEATKTAPIYAELRTELGISEFTGYESDATDSEIVAVLQEGQRVSSVSAGEEAEVITRSTPFYAESGGQVGDQGWVHSDRFRFAVRDTHKPSEGLHVHRGVVETGTLQAGGPVRLEVDTHRRTAIRRSHSATHLLHYALRAVLGEQATQKGSLVEPDRVRFDFSSSRPLTEQERIQVEDLVNAKILENAAVETDVLSMEEAKRRGAIGLFGEKYGAVVRMLTMTADSIELCGGTHATRTGDIGLLRIVSEGSLAAGVRRIEAVTGEQAIQYTRGIERELDRVASILRVPAERVVDRVERLIQQQKEQAREIEQLKRRLVAGGPQDFAASAREVKGVKVLGTKVELGDAKALRELADQLRDRLAPAVVLLGTEAKGGKALLACSVSADVTDRFQAGAIVREAAKIVGGGGGGRPDFAQAGGQDPSRLDEAVATVYDMVQAS